MISFKPPVLLISNLFSVGPAYGGTCKDLAEKLIRNDWSVVTTSGVRNQYLRPIDMLMTIWLTRNHYTVAQVDVFSGTAFRWAELSAWALRRLGKPYVLTLRGGNLPAFSVGCSNRVKYLLQSANLVTTPSNFLKSSFVDFRDDILLIRNAIDLNAYKFECRPQPKPRIAWLRAFHKIYNPVIAAQTLSLLVEEFSDIELTMFGPDKGDGALQEMQAWIQQAGIASRVYITGAIPKAEIPTRLVSYDIFLNTTTAESFGVSVMEAAALGMCIVTTNVGELPHIWTHDHDALLVPPNDPQAMANAIRRILTEPRLAERLSRNARNTAEQFDWSVILPQWETLLTEVIERHVHG